MRPSRLALNSANLDSSRREFLIRTGVSSAAILGATSLPVGTLLAEDKPAVPTAKADSCIFIWLGGGACHIDTLDPKVKGDPQAKKAGSYYDPIETAIPGVQVCQHLHRTANYLD